MAWPSLVLTLMNGHTPLVTLDQWATALVSQQCYLWGFKRHGIWGFTPDRVGTCWVCLSSLEILRGDQFGSLCAASDEEGGGWGGGIECVKLGEDIRLGAADQLRSGELWVAQHPFSSSASPLPGEHSSSESDRF